MDKMLTQYNCKCGYNHTEMFESVFVVPFKIICPKCNEYMDRVICCKTQKRKIHNLEETKNMDFSYPLETDL